MEQINRTPYAMEATVILDREGNETLLVVLKGTFQFDQRATQLAEQQAPITYGDEYHGDPTTTSLRAASDLLPLRPQTGVTLTGHAVCAGGTVGQMNVGIKVGDLQQIAVVYGDREGFQNVDKPEPFERMPLTWENAYGGFDHSHDKEKHHDAFQDNPVGRGFFARKSKRASQSVPLPNVENPSQTLRSPHDDTSAVGFGPIPPSWLARRQYAGTYDQQWEEQRFPLLPLDFDVRFLQAAPPQLTSDGYLEGKERCVLLGVTEEGRNDFTMDAHAPVVGVRMFKKGVRAHPKLESIHFDCDQRRYMICWKSMINVQGRVEGLESVEARLR
ncbi:MAG: DUF2169 domain-containing protein [Pseudomonadota bacterium]